MPYDSGKPLTYMNFVHFILVKFIYSKTLQIQSKASVVKSWG